MPFNGSGTYAAPASSWNPAVTNTAINSTDWIALLADLTTALSLTICKDGQSTPTANIPMGGFKLTGLASGSSATDSATFLQAQTASQAASYLTATAGTNTITATATPAATLAVGQRYFFLAAGTNTGATTLQIGANSAGAVQSNGVALVGGEIQSGSVICVEVSATTPVFQLIGNGSTLPFIDTLPFVHGSADATKKVRLEVDGLTTATTRVITIPDADVTLGLGAASGVGQTFLGSDVALNNTANYFNVCNTGSIGGAGQTWLIIATICALDTAAAAAFRLRIWDTSTVFVETVTTASAASLECVTTIMAIVSPSAAATYHLSAKDATSVNGVAKTSSSAGTANKATSITAIRLV